MDMVHLNRLGGRPAGLLVAAALLLAIFAVPGHTASGSKYSCRPKAPYSMWYQYYEASYPNGNVGRIHKRMIRRGEAGPDIWRMSWKRHSGFAICKARLTNHSGAVKNIKTGSTRGHYDYPQIEGEGMPFRRITVYLRRRR